MLGEKKLSMLSSLLFLVCGIDPAYCFHTKRSTSINNTSKFCFFGQSWHNKRFCLFSFFAFATLNMYTVINHLSWSHPWHCHCSICRYTTLLEQLCSNSSNIPEQMDVCLMTSWCMRRRKQLKQGVDNSRGLSCARVLHILYLFGVALVPRDLCYPNQAACWRTELSVRQTIWQTSYKFSTWMGTRVHGKKLGTGPAKLPPQTRRKESVAIETRFLIILWRLLLQIRNLLRMENGVAGRRLRPPQQKTHNQIGSTEKKLKMHRCTMHQELLRRLVRNWRSSGSPVQLCSVQRQAKPAQSPCLVL